MERKFKSRYAYMSETGKRISRGAWERMNRHYAVYPQKKLQIVGYEKNPDGSNNLSKPLVRQCQTLVLLPDTPKHSRKVTLGDRYMPNRKRARFPEGKEAGIQK